jgi:hypothetical protein
MQRRHRLENSYCRDFSCCGTNFADMHDLLQHYEELHGNNIAVLDGMALDSDGSDLDENDAGSVDDELDVDVGIERELRDVLANAAAAGFAGFDTEGNPIFAVSTAAAPAQATLQDFRNSLAGIVRGVAAEDDLPFELEDMDSAVEIPPMIAAALAQITGNHRPDLDGLGAVSMAEVAVEPRDVAVVSLFGSTNSTDSDATDTDEEEMISLSSPEAVAGDDEDMYGRRKRSGRITRKRDRERKRSRRAQVVDEDELMLSAALQQSLLDTPGASREGSPFASSSRLRDRGSRRGTPTPISKNSTPSREMRHRRRQGLIAGIEELTAEFGGNSTASDDGADVEPEEVQRLTALANRKQQQQQAVRKLTIRNNQLITQGDEDDTDVSGDEGDQVNQMLLRLKPEHQRIPKLPTLSTPIPQKGVFADSAPVFGMLQGDGTPFPTGVLPPTFASVAAKKKGVSTSSFPAMAPPAAFTPGVVPARVKTPAQRSPARTGTPASTYSGDGDDGRKYICEQLGCEKKYKNPGGLKYHMQVSRCCWACLLCRRS